MSSSVNLRKNRYRYSNGRNQRGLKEMSDAIMLNGYGSLRKETNGFEACRPAECYPHIPLIVDLNRDTQLSHGLAVVGLFGLLARLFLETTRMLDTLGLLGEIVVVLLLD